MTPHRFRAAAEDEVNRVAHEMASVMAEIESMAEMLRSEGFEGEATILETHLLMLQDESVRVSVARTIEDRGLTAEEAVAQIFGEMKERLRRADNEIAAARSAGARAVIVEYGTPLSQAAIIARAFSIPVLRITGTSNLRESIGASVVVDAENARLIIHPDDNDMPRPVVSPPTSSEHAAMPSPGSIWANVVDSNGPGPRHATILRGVGLYRSEFLLTERTEGFPSEEEQFNVYSTLCSRWAGYTVTIRTFDIGGDKVLPYFSLGPQQNPNLGLRAHRLYRFHPELFLTQMRAILRAGIAGVKLRILYPMVESVDAWLFLQELVERAVGDLERDGVPYQRHFEQGVMIEVPSAVWTLRDLLDRVDFASVGTNDLLQYHFAIDRGNPNVSSRYRPEHPSALRMLKHIADIALAAGKRVTVCGEMAADPRMTPLLLGLGFSDLSMDVHAIDAVHHASTDGSLEEFQTLALRCVNTSTADEVREILNERPVPTPVLPPDALDTGPADPVCGMSVSREGNPHEHSDGTATYYFCSEQCMNTFAARLAAPTPPEAAD